MWRIKDWDKHFENSQSRRYPKIGWVPIPNRLDGDGYTELMDHDHGAAHYGVWITLIQIASKCYPRGTLARDGGRPHDWCSLSRISRIGSHMIREAVPRFLDIGWLEDVPDSALGVLSECSHKNLNGTELKELNFSQSGVEVGFLDSSDTDRWAMATRLQVEAANKLWPRRNWTQYPMRPEDRTLLMKSAYLALTRFSLDWWHSALSEVAAAKDTKKPLGLFKTCLWKRPRREGVDLNMLLDLVDVPAKQPPRDGEPIDLVNIGAIPE